jgi:hypothetical protein
VKLRRLSARLRRPRPSDFAYFGLVAALTFLAARVWWLSAIVPGQDYPQFLVFVRVAQDYLDPASPFHGTYTVVSYIPTWLPTQLTRCLWVYGGMSLETAGKVLLTLQSLMLVGASAFLLRTLGRPRWAIVLLFPLFHSRWMVASGFACYATSFPFVILGWALAVRWLQRLDLIWGLLFALDLCVAISWHGLCFAMLGLGFAVLWALWRAPSLTARIKSTTATLPGLAIFAAWVASTYAKPHASSTWRWRALGEALDNLHLHVAPGIPHAPGRLLLLAALVIAGLLASRRTLGASGPAARMWRVDNPFLALAGVYLIAFFAMPQDGLGVEILAPRFSIMAALSIVFAWNLPASPAPRVVVVASMAAFGVWCLDAVADCFRAFDDETRGASALLDRLGPYDTLYYSPPQYGASAAFAPPNKTMIELEQFATARVGGLPNSSFAGYGVNYVRYVNDNPMPSFRGPPQYGREITKFDYVLTRSGQGPSDPHFRLLEEREGWQLYSVCGSKRFPQCGGAG